MLRAETLIPTTRASTRCAGAQERPIRRSQRSSEPQRLIEVGVAARPELRVNVDKPVAPVLNRAVPSAPVAAPRGPAVDDAINYRFIGDFIMKIRRSIQHRFASRSMNLVALLAIAFGGANVALAQTQQQLFASPEEATRALVTASQAKDQSSLARIFGPRI